MKIKKGRSTYDALFVDYRLILKMIGLFWLALAFEAPKDLVSFI